jgi:hypothetical protein
MWNNRIRAIVIAGGALIAISAGMFLLHRTRSFAFTGSSTAGSDAALQSAASGSLRKVESATGGYVLTLPAEWYAEVRSSGSAAFYPSLVSPSSSPQCKIEVSSFPPVASSEREAWIGAMIAGDPTLVIHADSRTPRIVAGMPATEWRGTIDDASTTLLYTFTPFHAYEIAPVAATGGHNFCGASREAFLAGLTFSSQQP